MARQIQIRRGSTAEIAAFTGAVGEVTADTTLDILQLHDGSLAGGHPIGLSGKGGDIASASPLVLDNDGAVFDVTGTTGFSAITVTAGRSFMLEFDGILTMTHGATLDLPGEANITTAAGDRGLFFARAANDVECFAFTRAAQSVDGASIGQQTIWVPAGAMKARATLGPSAGAAVIGTSLVEIATLDFDTAQDEYASFHIFMPKGWDLGTLIAQFIWSNASSTGTVAFGISAIALDDSDAMGFSRVGDGVGTVVVTTDTMLTADDLHISPESGAVTVAGSPTDEEWVYCEILRDITADTLGVDARLHGVKIHYTLATANDS